MKVYRSNGKLLISGEYFVLAGAKAFAIPLKKGQQLRVEENESIPGILSWQSFFDGQAFLELQTTWPELQIVRTSNISSGERLMEVLREACRLNPSIGAEYKGISFRSEADFKSDWGFGSSSTLVANIAAWAQIDPYQLNQRTFRSSGYDIACALHSKPLFYRLDNGNPSVETISFNPIFKDQLFFVYSGQKQDSRKSVQTIQRKINNAASTLLSKISDLSTALAFAPDLESFEISLRQHDELVSKVLDLNPVSNSMFIGFPGYVKSLGAWGGDFLLACWHGAPEEALAYFNKKGFGTVFKFSDLVNEPEESIHTGTQKECIKS